MTKITKEDKLYCEIQELYKRLKDVKNNNNFYKLKQEMGNKKEKLMSMIDIRLGGVKWIIIITN